MAATRCGDGHQLEVTARGGHGPLIHDLTYVPLPLSPQDVQVFGPPPEHGCDSGDIRQVAAPRQLGVVGEQYVALGQTLGAARALGVVPHLGQGGGGRGGGGGEGENIQGNDGILGDVWNRDESAPSPTLPHLCCPTPSADHSLHLVHMKAFRITPKT